MYRILKDRAAGVEKAVTEFARKLVATPSASLAETRVAELVEAEMKLIGYDTVVRDAAGNVVGALLGREAAPTVLLNSHMDTVGAGDETKWTRNPWGATVADGRLHGLGAADCKGGLAAQVYAGAVLKDSMLPLKGNLVVAATVAEENGRSIGVRELMTRTLPDMDLTPTWAILGEPTSLGLYYGHDGWLELDIVVAGANPFHVDDAARAIHDDLSAERSEPASGGPEVEWEEIHPPVFTDDGDSRRATIRMERRIAPAERVEQIVRQLEHDASLVTEAGGEVAVEVTVRNAPQKLYTGKTTMVRHVTNAWAIDPYDGLMVRARQSLSAAGLEVRSGKWALGRLGMGTAGGTFVTEFGIPAVGYGPGSEDQAHAVDESVSIADIVQATYGTTAVVHGLIGVPVCGWTSEEI